MKPRANDVEFGRRFRYPPAVWAMRSVPGGIKVVVHPPIRSTDANELCEKSFKTIKETLVQYS